MEREEAIQILADLTDNLFLHTWEEQYKALHMAIEALTYKNLKKPNNTCEVDLISRVDAIEAVKDTILKRFNLADWYEEMLNCGVEIEDRIKALPSAETVPQLKQTDTLIIADALRYLAKDTERHLVDRTRADALRQQFLKYGASMCKGGDDE